MEIVTPPCWRDDQGVGISFINNQSKSVTRELITSILCDKKFALIARTNIALLIELKPAAYRNTLIMQWDKESIIPFKGNQQCAFTGAALNKCLVTQ